MSMFCYQCEQTAKGEGCTKFGVCGKDPEVAALQDLLVHAAKGISMYAHRAGKLGVHDHNVDVFVMEALFTTVTNVNFDAARLQAELNRAAAIKARAKALYHDAAIKAGNIEEELSGPAAWQAVGDLQGLVREGEEVGILARQAELGPDVTALQELLTYGLKGTAAYADHAFILGKEDRDVYMFFHEALDFLASGEQTVDNLLGLCLRCGEVNLSVMGLLDGANTGAYGNPVPTPVRVEPVKGGAVKHFYLIGGCDGAKPGRNYYTEFAEAVPDDCVILTLACGKYRFNKLDFGDIGGIPRLLDIGQCNDAYSAIQIAVALAEAFDTDVNSLPLSMILSWYEQKAVCILLTLLHLGIKNIKLGPSLPAFVTPAILDVLVEMFNIAPVTTVEADLAETLGN